MKTLSEIRSRWKYTYQLIQRHENGWVLANFEWYHRTTFDPLHAWARHDMRRGGVGWAIIRSDGVIIAQSKDAE